jgi:hypothetical protein
MWHFQRQPASQPIKSIKSGSDYPNSWELPQTEGMDGRMDNMSKSRWKCVCFFFSDADFLSGGLVWLRRSGFLESGFREIYSVRLVGFGWVAGWWLMIHGWWLTADGWWLMTDRVKLLFVTVL